ncbi:MAG: prepilin-type N-terminal cleavage/methylation domain-containing protein [Candidatus Cloacimonadales bacterium]
MTVDHSTNKSRIKDSGYSMIELMAVLVISTIIFLGATLAISTFFLKFQELQRISVLNREAFNCMQVIKHGVTVGIGGKTQFMGVINADEAELTGNYVEGGRTALLLKPPTSHSEYSAHDQIKIFLSEGHVRYEQYVFGSEGTTSRERYIFPKRVNTKNQIMEVTKLVFRNGNPTANNIKIVKVELEARVEISRTNKTTRNYHTVRYETFMAIGKM